MLLSFFFFSDRLLFFFLLLFLFYVFLFYLCALQGTWTHSPMHNVHVPNQLNNSQGWSGCSFAFLFSYTICFWKCFYTVSPTRNLVKVFVPFMTRWQHPLDCNWILFMSYNLKMFFPIEIKILPNIILQSANFINMFIPFISDNIEKSLDLLVWRTNSKAIQFSWLKTCILLQECCCALYSCDL